MSRGLSRSVRSSDVRGLDFSDSRRTDVSMLCAARALLHRGLVSNNAERYASCRNRTRCTGTAASFRRSTNGSLRRSRGRALEWSRELGTWSVLDSHGYIEDAALAVPLSIDALLHAANTNDAVAYALVARQNPIIEAVRARARAEGKAKGRAEGKAEMLIAFLTARGIELGAGERDRILGECDPARLVRWAIRAATCRSLEELFAE